MLLMYVRRSCLLLCVIIRQGPFLSQEKPCNMALFLGDFMICILDCILVISTLILHLNVVVDENASVSFRSGSVFFSPDCCGPNIKNSSRFHAQLLYCSVAFSLFLRFTKYVTCRLCFHSQTLVFVLYKQIACAHVQCNTLKLKRT